MQDELNRQSQPSRQIVVSAIAWATIQSWGGRAFSFVLLVLLARLLHPADFGIFAIAVLVQFLISQVAELGFGEALVQRRQLKPSDINLPFYVSMALSTTLAVAVALFADNVATLAGVPASADIVRALCATAPFVTASAFQEALYRRNMKFKPLAVRMLVGIVLGGFGAVGAALAGWGVWSLFVQSVVGTLVSLVWLWTRPVWVPTLKLSVPSFRHLIGFSANVFMIRLLDFGSARGIEIVLAHSLGTAALGLYTAAQRLNATLLQLLQSAFVDVTLSSLSRVQHDTEMIRSTYMKTLSLSLLLGAPPFVLAAAVSPELVYVLLGEKWAGVEAILVPLFCMGAVQAVQLMNGPYMTASGKPYITLMLVILRLPIVFVVLFATYGGPLPVVITSYVLSLLSVAPLSFWISARVLRASAFDVLSRVFVSYAALSVSYGATVLIRYLLSTNGLSYGPIWEGILITIVFLTAYTLCAATVMRRPISDAMSLFSRNGKADDNAAVRTYSTNSVPTK